MEADLLKKVLNRYLKLLSNRIKTEYNEDVEFKIYSLNYFRNLENDIFLHVFIDTNPEIKRGNDRYGLREGIIKEVRQFLKETVGVNNVKHIIIDLDKRPLYNIDEEKLPFKEKKSKNLRLREFSERVESEELKWHFDDEDRMVKTLHKTDWMIQFDNKMPQKLSENREIFIPKGVYHRLIKGTGDLKVKIRLI